MPMTNEELETLLNKYKDLPTEENQSRLDQIVQGETSSPKVQDELVNPPSTEQETPDESVDRKEQMFGSIMRDFNPNDQVTSAQASTAAQAINTEADKASQETPASIEEKPSTKTPALAPQILTSTQELPKTSPTAQGINAAIEQTTGAPSAPNYEQMLQQAQEQSRAEKLLMGLGRAAEYIGAGVGGVVGHAPSKEFLEQYSPEAANKELQSKLSGIESLAKARELDTARKLQQSEMDPNSERSKIKRNMYNQILGKRVFGDNVAAAEIDKTFPQLAKIWEMKEASAQRREMAAQRQADMDKWKQMSYNLQQGRFETGKENVLVKRGDDLNKKLTEELASSRSAFGRMANIKRSADAIDTLIQSVPNPNNLDSRQIMEVARNLDAMLSQGVPTISGTEHLIPNTATGSAAKIAEYITSIPTGAQQGAFVKRMQETVRRERELAKTQIKATGNKILASYRDLREKDPQRYNDVLKAHELDDVFNEPTATKESAKQAMPGQDPKILDYSKQHNLSYDQAKGILVGRGYKPQE